MFSRGSLFVHDFWFRFLRFAKCIAPAFISQIDKITVISGGNGSNGVEEVVNTAPLVIARLFETMKETTGVDLGEIFRAQTYDADVNYIRRLFYDSSRRYFRVQ